MRRRRLAAYVTCCLVLLALFDVVSPVPALAQTLRPPARKPASPPPGRELNTEAVERCRKGEYAEAIVTARDALALREKALGPEHLLVAESLQTLADCLRESGELLEPRPLYERALAIREKALGPEHATVARSLHELGTLLHRRGEFATARPLLERGLAIREKVYGPEHVDVATSVQ